MKEMFTGIGQTSEKAGYVVGTATIAFMLFFGAINPNLAVNLLAGSGALIVGGKLAQKKG